ncbi:amidohydrolase family protein [Streptomyces sp. NPDC012765]|uniref:amidohydrolase family protein n=1 Tax=Streptomyces sp. NPDC012765 TaxID=3155249 RepID=UPI0033FA14F9
MTADTHRHRARPGRRPPHRGRRPGRAAVPPRTPHRVDLATSGAARALGIDGDTGRLAAGFRADLLVVDGDPLIDLAALRAVRLVVADGRPAGPSHADPGGRALPDAS